MLIAGIGSLGIVIWSKLIIIVTILIVIRILAILIIAAWKFNSPKFS